ncbi:MAG: hypothetical protein KKG76_07820 [Euryarchaeota archaeon]|nr:hypothetical protein [Euryarchaeota archaeon]
MEKSGDSDGKCFGKILFFRILVLMTVHKGLIGGFGNQTVLKNSFYTL